MANRSVLLVDANGSALRQARITLEFEGLEVVEALDGEQGLSAARKQRFGLVISAVGIPRLNGYDLCKALREMAPFAEVPILLTFSSMDVFDGARAERVGASSSLAKPFLPSQLLDRVAAICGADFLGADHGDMALASLAEDVGLTSAESAFLEDSREEPPTLGSDFVASVDDAVTASGEPIASGTPFTGVTATSGDATSSSGPSFSQAKSAMPGQGPPVLHPPERDLQALIQASVDRYLDEHLPGLVQQALEKRLPDDDA
jgi:two-component system, chemotaxis family, chemotaxis protein CheY